MVPSSRFCTACGAANQAQDAFCFNCGLPLRASIPSSSYLVAGSTLSSLTGLLPPNLLLRQRYRILNQLGKGGFSAIYKAEDIQFGNRLLAVNEALDACEQAIRLNPRLAVAYANKSGALKRLGRSKEAQVAYKRAQLFGYTG